MWNTFSKCIERAGRAGIARCRFARVAHKRAILGFAAKFRNISTPAESFKFVFRLFDCRHWKNKKSLIVMGNDTRVVVAKANDVIR
jgi:hypothetical protein